MLGAVGRHDNGIAPPDDPGPALASISGWPSSCAAAAKARPRRFATAPWRLAGDDIGVRIVNAAEFAPGSRASGAQTRPRYGRAAPRGSVCGVCQPRRLARAPALIQFRRAPPRRRQQQHRGGKPLDRSAPKNRRPAALPPRHMTQTAFCQVSRRPPHNALRRNLRPPRRQALRFPGKIAQWLTIAENPRPRLPRAVRSA